MSCNYADGLSEYHDKGVCGLPEIHDDPETTLEKVKQLAEMIRQANHVVIHTGAGISTAAGIPDFRGPKGVWTLENQGVKPEVNISFDNAVPTRTHMALLALTNAGFVHYVISQNVDGLFIRCGFPAEKLSELHGNMLLDKCAQCERLFIRNTASATVGQKCTGQACPLPKANGRACRGKLHDTILDWEDELPGKDLELAEIHSRNADLSICLGSTLQIIPSGNLPLLTKNNGGKLIICNLQPTKHDRHADMIIHDYVDSVISQLAKFLGVEIPEYSPATDLTKCEPPVEYRPATSDIRRQRRKTSNNVLKKELSDIKKNESKESLSPSNETDCLNQQHNEEEVKSDQLRTCLKAEECCDEIVDTKRLKTEFSDDILSSVDIKSQISYERTVTENGIDVNSSLTEIS